MREIKFRAWSSVRKEMAEVEIIHFKGNAVYLISKYLRLVANLDETELMQFTGQKDMNGKEVFEEDILKLENGDFGIVQYNNLNCNYYIQLINYHFNVAIDFKKVFSYQSKVEIIGNKYENPELLEVGRWYIG